jgi:hypothetical protein
MKTAGPIRDAEAKGLCVSCVDRKERKEDGKKLVPEESR